MNKHVESAAPALARTEAVFQKTFQASDPFLRDHVIGGRAIVPAAVYLEMALMAARHHSGRAALATVNDLVLSRPMVPDAGPGAAVLRVRLQQQEHGCTVDFSSGPAERALAHASATVSFAAADGAHAPRYQPCPEQLDGAAFYAMLARRGLDYGAALRAVQSFSHDGLAHAEARLALPAALDAEFSFYALHPALLDAMLQAAAALFYQTEGATAGTYVPHRIGKMTLHRPLERNALVRLTLRKDAASAEFIYDIALLANDGALLLSIEGLVGRALASPAPAPAAPAPQAARWYGYAWQDAPATGAAVPRAPAAALVFGDPLHADALRAALAHTRVVLLTPGHVYAQRSPDHFIVGPAVAEDIRAICALLAHEGQAPGWAFHLPPAADAKTAQQPGAAWLDAALQAQVFPVLDMGKALASAAQPVRLISIGIFAAPGAADGLPAALATLGSEMPSFDGISIVLDRLPAPDALARLAIDEAAHAARGACLHYRAGQRMRRRIVALPLPAARFDFSGAGCVAITGGSGKLGLLLAAHIGRQAPVLLIGRSAPDPAQLAQLEAQGVKLLYCRADVGERQALAEALAAGRQRFGAIHGVMHAAGIVRDGYYAGKSQADFSAVLAPKVVGAALLDELTAADALGFFVCFSSISAVIANPGQTDYATANAALDQAMAYRAQQVDAGLRRGRSLSLNWPLWEDGGMHVPAALLARFEERTGMRALASASALQALETGLNGTAPNLMPLCGDHARIASFLDVASVAEAAPAARADLMDDLRILFAEVLKLAPAQLGPDTPFEQLAIDSFLVLELNGRLSKLVGKIPATLLYQYTTLRALAAHLEGLMPSRPAAAPAPVAAPTPSPVAGMDLVAGLRAYLSEVVADALKCDIAAVRGESSFEQLGVDSFLLLQLTQTLERDFGVLPKTLLYSFGNVDALAAHLAERYPQQVAARVGAPLPPVAAAVAPVTIVAAPVVPVTPPTATPAAPPAAPQAPGNWFDAAALAADARLRAVLEDLLQRYGMEAGQAVARASLAPHAFLTGAEDAAFFLNRRANSVLAFAYAGPDAGFKDAAQALIAHCEQRGWSVNILEEAPRAQILAQLGCSTTAFGMMQTIDTLAAFTVQGTRMRRLRYLIQRYEAAGQCAVREYRPGSEPATDSAIGALITRWSEHKGQVGPYVAQFARQLAAGQLEPAQRLFLTERAGQLDNAIVITRLAPANGYLMDLEFYGAEMPLGGLEFSIAHIMNVLRQEGAGYFSLGATFGVQLDAHADEDPGVGAMLRGLHESHLFNNEGNFQFKNKFRPRNVRIFACRSAASTAPFADVLMMFADPEQQRDQGAATPASAPAPAPVALPAPQAAAPGPAARLALLAQAHYNVLALPAASVPCDLKTDSWAELSGAYVGSAIAQLAPGTGPSAHSAAAALFPFEHVFVVAQGRYAEALLCQALGTPGAMAQNLLFPTYLYHQIGNGITPLEMPCQDSHAQVSANPFRANLDLAALSAALAAGEVRGVCIELACNAVGGAPVSLAHLRQVRALTLAAGVPLLLDATRLLSNSLLVQSLEAGYAGRALAAIAAETLALADAVSISLGKDFGVDCGAVLAVREPQLAGAIEDLLTVQGNGLSGRDEALIAAALARPWTVLEQAARARIEAVRTIGAGLRAAGVPVLETGGGHCVLIDLRAAGAQPARALPVADYLAWLFYASGIRAGELIGGMGGRATAGLVRLAIPLGLPMADAVRIGAAVAAAHRQFALAPALQLALAGRGVSAAPKVRYAKTGAADFAPPAGAVEAPDQRAPAAVPVAAAVVAAPNVNDGDMAIVGVSVRLPGADNLEQLWSLLSEGRDAITEVPLARWDHRSQKNRHGQTDTAWGGFIADVDKFDPLFFGISPREAELMDPQERLFLQAAWHAVEDAGYNRAELSAVCPARNVGVFVGVVWSLYHAIGVEEMTKGNVVTPNSFHWSIANRVSYILDLHGPSMALDTACSSSLSALHMACESIRRGESSMAIVGGVNLDLHPSKPHVTNQGRVLSPDGKCRSFGAGANGYVPGEGVGALLIKSLRDAERDGDHVYALVKASAVNHGGRSNGYTAPSPPAQAQLVSSVLARAGVAAASIGYVEAHGTGTVLGDPIEIEGLQQAFGATPEQGQFCAVGSVKTNIGHLEAAAGIAGIAKVLVQMRHRTLVPSLHAEQPNPHIDFGSTPFYVPTRLAPWHPNPGQGADAPLRAAVSSFGAGGANAHALLEQYRRPEAALAPGAQLIVLSARNGERLAASAAALLAFLEAVPAPLDLAAIAHTLQHGREAMEARLALVVNDGAALLAALRRFGEQGAQGSGLHCGQVQGASQGAGADAQAALASADLEQLARLWVTGAWSDLRALAPQPAVRRVSLPGYPFLRERHWVTALPAAQESIPLPAAQESILPPAVHDSAMPPVPAAALLDAGTGGADGCVFHKRFSGEEFELREHVVIDTHTLPGVAYLEMARQACLRAAPGRASGVIRNLVWVRPIGVGTTSGAVDVAVRLTVKADHLAVAITTGDGAALLVHAQCKMSLGPQPQAALAPSRSLAAIGALCPQFQDKEAIYANLRAQGMQHGPAFQVLGELHSNARQAWAPMRLPAALEPQFGAYGLHPALMDGALQAAAAFAHGDAAPRGVPDIPFVMAEVTLFQPLTTSCFVIVEMDEKSTPQVRKFNIDIVGADGRVQVRMSGFSARSAVPATPSAPSAAAPAGGELLQLIPQWLAAPPVAARASALQHAHPVLLVLDADARRQSQLQQAAAADGWERIVWVTTGVRFERLARSAYVIAPGSSADYLALLQALEQDGLFPSHVLHLLGLRGAHAASGLEPLLELGVLSALHLAQAWQRRNPRAALRLLMAHDGQDGQAAGEAGPAMAACAAFGRSVQRELPHFGLLTAQLPHDSDAYLAAVLKDLGRAEAQVCELRYGPDGRAWRSMRELEPAAPAASGPWLRQGGVYLITGGAGGVGLLMAAHLLRSYGASVALVGRSALDAGARARLLAVEADPARLRYYAADVTSGAGVQTLVAQVSADFGALHGVLHCAGVLDDAALAAKSEARFRAVIAPKLQGTIHLDQATAALELDCFVLFSSLAGVTGNRGQTDYAYANRFMDEFAAQRAVRVGLGQRHGRSLSIAWPLWADGGMQVSAAIGQWLERTLGMHALPSAIALDTFDAAGRSGHASVALLYGERGRLRALIDASFPLPAGQIAQDAADAAHPSHAPDPARPIALHGV